jgi:hypothetical protein
MIRGNHHAETRGRFTLNVDTDRPAKIVFENRPGPSMEIDPDPASRDGLVDQFMKVLHRDALGKLAGAGCIAGRPMPLLDMPEPPIGQDGDAVHVPEIASAPVIIASGRGGYGPTGESQEAEEEG